MSLKESMTNGGKQVILKQCEYEIVAKLASSLAVQKSTNRKFQYFELR
jgi:hypothetical protein